jgi:hypothetical protein
VAKTVEAAPPTNTGLSSLFRTPDGRFRGIVVWILILAIGLAVYLINRTTHDREISSYEGFVTKLQSEIRDLADANTKHAGTITDLQRQLEKVEADLHAVMPSQGTYNVASNQSLLVADGQFTVGLIGNPTIQRANVNINGEQRSVVAGDVISFALNPSTTCKVGVQSFDMFKVVLTASCSPEKP